MRSSHYLRAPFVYFGGKSAAAPLIWSLLGDPAGYIEPFAGSAAVLLTRPGAAQSATWCRSEILNDADGWLINTWRALTLNPSLVAEHARGPITEIDYHARLAWLETRRDDDLVAWLEGDPEHHDPKAAGWWLYVQTARIGSPGKGPWQVVDGKLTKAGPGRGVIREIPQLTHGGINTAATQDHLTDWFTTIAHRLRYTRITCGDWQRVLAPTALRLKIGGDRSTAIFLDPPYATSGDLYTHGSTTISTEVRDWCLQHTDQDLRIVLAGYHTEHDELLAHGWTKHESRASGAGYGAVPATERERLWASPACNNHHTPGLW